MPIDDQQIIKFSNERLRKFCNQLGNTYNKAKQLITIYESKEFEAVILAASGEFLMDGSPNDGRTPLTGLDIYKVKRIADWIVANSEADGNYVVNQVFKTGNIFDDIGPQI